MFINKAILKHGYYNFRLDILEYCAPEECIEREQFYIDALKPEYNILIRAGSSLGFKHSEKTKLRMKTKTPEHLIKIKNNSILGKPIEIGSKMDKHITIQSQTSHNYVQNIKHNYLANYP